MDLRCEIRNHKDGKSAVTILVLLDDNLTHDSHVCPCYRVLGDSISFAKLFPSVILPKFIIVALLTL